VDKGIAMNDSVEEKDRRIFQNGMDKVIYKSP
jgi:hypothetical protein